MLIRSYDDAMAFLPELQFPVIIICMSDRSPKSACQVNNASEYGAALYHWHLYPHRTVIVTSLAGNSPVATASTRSGATPALDDIAAERKRQVEVEGYTLEHDDEHSAGELAMAAASYAISAGQFNDVAIRIGSGRRARFSAIAPLSVLLWPWNGGSWKRGNARRMLVKAGSLIVAEIERLDRLEATEAKR